MSTSGETTSMQIHQDGSTGDTASNTSESTTAERVKAHPWRSNWLRKSRMQHNDVKDGVWTSDRTAKAKSEDSMLRKSSARNSRCDDVSNYVRGSDLSDAATYAASDSGDEDGFCERPAQRRKITHPDDESKAAISDWIATLKADPTPGDHADMQYDASDSSSVCCATDVSQDSSASASDPVFADEEIHFQVVDAIQRIDRLHDLGYSSMQERIMFVKWTIMRWEQMQPPDEGVVECNEIHYDQSTQQPALRRTRMADDGVPLGQIRGPGR